MPSNPFSGLALVKLVDTWPYYQQNPAAYKAWMQDYYYVMFEGYPKPFGYMHKSILQGLKLSPNWKVNSEQRLLTMVQASSFQERTQVMRDLLLRAVKEGAPASPRKFYDEALRVMSEGEHVLDTDRSGLDPFGLVSFSAYLIGFVRDNNDTKYWVPKRSATKPTVPNKLDSTVAGLSGQGSDLSTAWRARLPLRHPFPRNTRGQTSSRAAPSITTELVCQVQGPSQQGKR